MSDEQLPEMITSDLKKYRELMMDESKTWNNSNELTEAGTNMQY